MKHVKRYIAVFVVTLFAIAYFNSEKPEPSSLTQPIAGVPTTTALPILSASPVPTETASPARPATQTAIPTATVQTELVYYYANASVSIRSCPNTDCSVVARLSIGDRIGVLSFVEGEAVYGNSDLWADVTIGNQPQFIYGELLSLTPVQVPVISPPEQNSSPVEPPAAPAQDSFVCPRNCDEAISWGWSAQEAGRCPNLDRDKDGVACYGD